jgi:Inhibitor of apoptosis-promoting Bax1
MTSFSIDKQRDKVNVEWMSRPVDSFKKSNNNQPLVLVLTSMEHSPTFAYRLKRKLLSGPIFGGAYRSRRHNMESYTCNGILVHYTISFYTLYAKRLFTLESYPFTLLTLSVLSIVPLVLFPDSRGEIIWCASGILLFRACILYDTSEIIHRYGPGDEVSAALDLYLDFVNIFWDFVRLFKRTNHEIVTGTDNSTSDVTDLLDSD